MERIPFSVKRFENIPLGDIFIPITMKAFPNEKKETLTTLFQTVTSVRDSIEPTNPDSWMNYYAYLESLQSYLKAKNIKCTPKSSTHWTNAINGGESKVKSLDGEQLICLLNAGLCYYESQRSYFDMNHLTLDKVKVIHQYNRKAAGYIHECVAFRQNHDIQSESTDLSETFLKFLENYLSVQNEMLTLSLNTQIGNKVEKVAHMYYQMGKYYEHLYDLLEDDCDFALMDHIYYNQYYCLFMAHYTVFESLYPLAKNYKGEYGTCSYHIKQCKAVLKEYLESAHSDSADYPKMAGMSASVDKYALEISTTLMHFREQEKPAVTFSDTPLKPNYTPIVYPPTSALFDTQYSTEVSTVIYRFSLAKLIPLKNSYEPYITELFKAIQQYLSNPTLYSLTQQPPKSKLPDDYKSGFEKFIADGGMNKLNEEIAKLKIAYGQTLKSVEKYVSLLLNTQKQDNEIRQSKPQHIPIMSYTTVNLLNQIQEYKQSLDQSNPLYLKIIQSYNQLKEKYSIYDCTVEQLEEMIPPPYTEIEQQHIQVIKTVMNSLIDQNEKLSIAWTQWCEKLDKNSLAEQLFLSDQHSYGNICEQFYDHMVTEYKMKIEVLVNSCSSSLQQISTNYTSLMNEHSKQTQNPTDEFYNNLLKYISEYNSLMDQISFALDYYTKRNAELEEFYNVCIVIW